MKYKEIAKKKWYVQGFGGCLNYLCHGPISSLVNMHKELGYGYTESVFVFQKDYTEYHYLEHDFIECGNEFLKRYGKDKGYLKQVLKKDTGLVKDMLDAIEKIKKIDLTKLDNKQVLEKYQGVWTQYHSFIGVSHIIEAITFVLEPLLKEKVEKAVNMGRHSVEFRKMFTALMQPEKPSFVNFEMIGLLKIIKVMEKKKLDVDDDKIKKMISRHRKEFFYNQLNYFHADGLTDDDYVKEIKKLLEEGIDADARIKEEEKRYKENIKKKSGIIKQYNLSQQIVDLVELSTAVLHWQDDRKMYILSCVYYLNLLLKELGKRFDIPLEMLKRYAPFELTMEKLNNFDKEEAKERIKHFAVYFERVNDKMETTFFEKEKYDMFMKTMLDKLAEKSDIHGNTASMGKASGIARVCRTKAEIMEFKQGEVLVAAMTRPEFVPAMKKAAAIVTDEGGLTCHAAIVSRELGIPCIVGTKVATKVLKTGDLVDVNADHGVVKVVK